MPCVRLRGRINLNFSPTWRRGLWCVISVRGKEGDRDLVYYSATTRYYAITLHFKRKVIVFSSSWRFLLNLSTTLIFVMKPAAFILGLHFIGVSLEHYHESNMWHNYNVTEEKFPTPCQGTEQVSSKLHKKAFQDQVERQDHNIHLHHTVISVL